MCICPVTMQFYHILAQLTFMHLEAWPAILFMFYTTITLVSVDSSGILQGQYQWPQKRLPLDRHLDRHTTS